MPVRLREILLSVNSFVAAMLALFISLTMGLERPFWAMATVYIISQPLAGTVRSKAAFRFGGTVIGAAATVLIVPPLSNAPVLLTLALALWICACQFLSLMDRTPRSYFFMLAGYTAGLIGFPAVDHPDQVFHIAVLRAEEIGVGVLCASLVHTIMFPRNVSTVLSAKLASISHDAQVWVLQALAGQATPRDAKERRTIAADITELHMLATHVPYDTETILPTRATLAAFQDRLMLLVPLVSAIEDRVLSLKDADAVTPDMQTLLDATRDWVSADKREEPQGLRQAIAALAAATHTHGWEPMLTHNLLARLTELIDLLILSRELSESLTKPARTLSPQAQTLVSSRLVRPLHIDKGMAFLSTIATFAAITGCCAFWIMSGWPEGSIAPMIAAVMCCFFATMDDPTVAQRGFLTWTAASLPLIALYQFAILPAVHGFVMLTLVLAPTLLVLGALLPLPQWYSRIMPIAMGFTTGIALTNVYAADFASFASANFAQLAGTAAAITATRLLRVVGPHTIAHRVLRTCWRELATMSGAGKPSMTVSQWTSLMLDRIQILTPRLASASTNERLAASDALRDLRIGINVLVLKNLDDLNESARSSIDGVLDGVATHFRDLERQPAPAPDMALISRIDHAMAGAHPLPALIALTGLRRNLFPEASAPALASEAPL
jgi:uncharacterized membrane protein YccC